MARSRRRRFSRMPMRARAQPRTYDWVYRNNGYQVNDFIGDGLGTYTPVVFPVSSGYTNAAVRILYDSSNYLTEVARNGGGPVQLGREARAEGRKPHVKRVQGIIYVEPSTWAVGNLIAAGFRIGVFEQSPADGFALVDANYTMWANIGGPYSTAQWANIRRQNVYERRVHFGFSDNQAFFTARFDVSVNRYLEANECLALYYELEDTSVNTRNQIWMRSLVGEP